jgi:uncharacterized protein
MSSLDPIILFFIFGALSGILKSPLRLPSQIYDFLTVILLIAIGLKGGVELSKLSLLSLLPQIGTVIAMGFALPFVAYPILRSVGKMQRADAASIAAHYGSVSVGTFAVAIAYVNSHNIPYEEHVALFVVLLEIPAILVGIVFARGISKGLQWGKITHEVFLGKGVILLIGGLAIGWIAGPQGVKSIEPLFFDLFKGVLALFLLEMGLITATHLSSLKKYGVFLIFFGILMPIFSALVGGILGHLLGLSIGGMTILATLAASASYIAVPAAMRISVPEANPTLSLTASLGITFPFNIIVGISLYHELSQLISRFL